MSSYKILRFSGNMNVIGKLVEDTDTEIVLEAPACIDFQMVSPGRLGIVFVPYCSYIDKVMGFDVGALIGPVVDAKGSLLENYCNIFHPSDIVAPPKPSLILGSD